MYRNVNSRMSITRLESDAKSTAETKSIYEQQKFYIKNGNEKKKRHRYSR